MKYSRDHQNKKYCLCEKLFSSTLTRLPKGEISDSVETGSRCFWSASSYV